MFSTAIGDVAGWYRWQYHSWVPSVAKIVARCARTLATSATPIWPRSASTTSGRREPAAGDPRVNIQNDHGAARAYQVRQVLAAIDKKEGAI